MMKPYFNQTATLQRASGTNEYGEPITIDQTIKARWQGGRRLVRDEAGREVVGEATCYCEEDVKPGDSIVYAGRTWGVISVTEKVGLDGNVLYREVVM